ncbi:unnamed protein product [Paramecium pentaurelia]|uniref:Uncharacterized protein n=1 Tax=Paramecium pentaurelia TaxID=43138 RepID=A0A8S1WF84_9CILI|nr:unnamed protein product [Paramecium pentaurelia]
MIVGQLISSQQYRITRCYFIQLKSEEKCIKMSQQYFNEIVQKSLLNFKNNYPPIPSYATYYDSFSKTDCRKAAHCTYCWNYSACAQVENKFTFFQSCGAFAKKSDQKCQAISNRFKSDGTLLMEIDDCTTYKKQIEFMLLEFNKQYMCRSNTCDKLPQSLISEKVCRDAIMTCTTKSEDGCIITKDNVFGINQKQQFISGIKQKLQRQKL